MQEPNAMSLEKSSWIGGRLRRGVLAAGILSASLLMAACTPSAPTGPGGSAYGNYSGGSTDSSLTIAFTAASSGISKLQGTVMLLCTQVNSSGLPYLVNSTIPLNGMSFTSDTTTKLSGSSTEEVKVAGTLDGSGHASGTLTFNLNSGGSNVCSSGTSPVNWTASVNGASNGSTTSPTPSSNSACTPQPCSSNDGVTVYVTSLKHDIVNYPPDPPVYQLAINFTVTNDSTSDVSVANGYFVVQPGNGQVVIPPLDGIILPDGSSCLPLADLPAGAHSDPQCVPVNLTTTQAAEPLKLIWRLTTSTGVASGSIDLSGVPIQ